MSEKVTERVRGGIIGGSSDHEVAEGGEYIVPMKVADEMLGRVNSVMEMYRWLKEEMKAGRDEEELEAAWSVLREMERAKRKMP